MEIRPFRVEQLEQVLSLFYSTVHTSNAKDYTESQLNAWAPVDLDANAWLKRLSDGVTLTAVEGETLLGFGNLENTHALDCLYVRHDAQGKGVGRALLHALEDIAWRKGAHSLTAEVSLTARPFFLCHGYQELRGQQVERGGVLLRNIVMVHDLKQ